MGRVNTPEDAFRYINTHNNDISVCWEWTGSLGGHDDRGYMSIGGRKYIVSRVIYELFNPPLQAGEVVRHICDNQLCCNPTHLEKGTRSDNELDKYRRGRAGLPVKIVKRMNQLFRQRPPLTYREVKEILDKEFDVTVSLSSVGKIFRQERRAKGNQDHGRKKRVEQQRNEE